MKFKVVQSYNDRELGLIDLRVDNCLNSRGKHSVFIKHLHKRLVELSIVNRPVKLSIQDSNETRIMYCQFQGTTFISSKYLIKE